MAVPPGPVPAPFNVSVAFPGATASNTIAARRPPPDAPVASAARVMVMSTRPGFTCWVNVAFTPPDRMKLPSDTLRTRSNIGSYIKVIVIVDSRDAPATVIGTVYGP